MQDVLQLLGAVEDEVLFRLVDMVAASETAEALLFLEELSSQGQDLGRLVIDLLEHLRHLLLVQHMHEVPESIPVTDEAKERLREQANQLPPATVVRLIDLLAVAVDDMRQGGDPRLPLELALVKVTSPSSDLSREALALPPRAARERHGTRPSAETLVRQTAHADESRAGADEPDAAAGNAVRRAGAAAGGVAPDDPAGGRVAVDPDRQDARRGAPVGARRRHADARVSADRVVPSGLAEDPKNAAMLREALYEVTGRKLAVDFALGETGHEQQTTTRRPARRTSSS